MFFFIILSASCKKLDTYDIPVDIEIAHYASTADRVLYENLQQVEEDSTIIVEAVAKDIIGQKVSTSYDYELQKELPGSGFTKRECEVTKVYKGDVESGDTVVLLQDYYIWTYTDKNTDKLKSKLDAGTLTQSELDVYDYDETLPYLIPIYSEVVEKYFSSD